MEMEAKEQIQKELRIIFNMGGLHDVRDKEHKDDSDVLDLRK